jgi:hypothetical protein
MACRPYVGGRPGAPQVALWGDSITHEATPRLRSVFEAEYATATWSYPGIVVRQASGEALSQIDYDPPDAFVVELGTNNIRAGDVDVDDLGQIHQLADVLRPSGCVVWVNVATTRPELMPLVAELDALLASVPAERPWIHVADWNRVAVVHPEWFRDGIHQTKAGIEAYAGWLRGQTEQLCGVRPVR